MSLNTGGASGKDGERARLNPTAVSGYSNGGSSGSAAAASTRTSDIEQAGSPLPRFDEESDHLDDVRKAAVFGALDGLLTSFAIVAGSAGGGLGTQAVLVVGISSIIADGLSMGLGEYLSSKAMNDYMDVERKREEWELTNHREGEVEAMIALYVRRGMSREDAQEVSSRLSKYDDCFVDAMMTEQVGNFSAPVDEGGSIREGMMTFASFALAGALPLLAYVLLPAWLALRNGGDGGDAPTASQGMMFLWACVVTAVALFSIGAVKSTFVSRSWFGSGMETLLLGGCCAGLAYEIGSVVASCLKSLE